MFKKLFIFLLISLALYSFDTKSAEGKTSLHLVVGSSRKSHFLEQFPYTQLWKENTANLTHIHTYKGNAITMDPDPCYFSNLVHLKEDPRFYQFNKQTIKAVYIEKTISYEDISQDNNPFSPQNKKYYFETCIPNISKHMESGAKIEIEYLPLVLLSNYGRNTVKSIFYQENLIHNPFSATINIELMLLGFEILCNKTIPNHTNFSPEFIAYAKQLGETFNHIVSFCESQKVGNRYLLIKRIKEELKLWNLLRLENLFAALSHGPSASLKNFSQAWEHFYIADNTIPIHAAITMKEKGLTVYNSDMILSRSLFYLLLRNTAIINNHEHVKKFMEVHGFKDVKLNRKTSPHNGRKNVWIISGIKK